MEVQSYKELSNVVLGNVDPANGNVVRELKKGRAHVACDGVGGSYRASTTNAVALSSSAGTVAGSSSSTGPIVPAGSKLIMEDLDMVFNHASSADSSKFLEDKANYPMVLRFEVGNSKNQKSIAKPAKSPFFKKRAHETYNAPENVWAKGNPKLNNFS